MTWAEIVALYKLTLDAPPHNLRPRFNVCPMDPIDVVTEQDGKRDFVRMRWGLVTSWWPRRRASRTAP
jgi:putative SOS response-associated peptidase YedK